MEKNKIGIDKISLTGFKVKYLNIINYDLDKKTKTTRQKVIKDNFERYQLIKYRIKEQNYYKLIIFPSRIIWGNNIKNVNIKELLKALEWTTQELKIKEIEININLKVSFKEYENTFKLLIPKAKIYGINKKNSVGIETIETKGKISSFKIYDKGKQNKLFCNLVRFEFYLKDAPYGAICKNMGYDGTLQTLIKKPFLIVEIFKHKIKEMYRKTSKIINKEIKKPLKDEYMKIKKYNSNADKKEIKQIYKQLENIKPFGIFDKNILINIIKESQEKNKKREIKKVMEKYKDFDGLEKLKHIYILIVVNGI